MKKLLLILLLLPVMASAETTTGGHVACLSEEWLDDMLDFAIAKDYAQMELYISQNRCIVVKAGLTVTVTDRGFLRSQFSYQGIKLWTANEGLKR